MTEQGPEPIRASASAELVQAIGKLTSVVSGLDQLLRDEYPKRTEIERRFVSKLESKSYMVRLVLVALLTVIACYATSTGAYSACFIGDTNSKYCKYVPGYGERVDRRNEIDQADREQKAKLERQAARIARLEKALGINGEG